MLVCSTSAVLDACKVCETLCEATLDWCLQCMQVYESGAVFDPMVLDITDDDLASTVQLGIKRIAAACLALNYPTLASIPHSIVNGYKNVLAVSVETEYTFPLAEKVNYFSVGSVALAALAHARHLVNMLLGIMFSLSCARLYLLVRSRLCLMALRWFYGAPA